MVSSLSLQWKSNMLEQARPSARWSSMQRTSWMEPCLTATYVCTCINEYLKWYRTAETNSNRSGICIDLPICTIIFGVFMCMYVSSRMQQTSYLVELQARLSLPRWPLLCCPLLRSQPYLPPPSGAFQTVWRLMSSAPTLPTCLKSPPSPVTGRDRSPALWSACQRLVCYHTFTLLILKYSIYTTVH